MKRTDEELQALVAGARYKVKDLNGKEWTLYLLDMKDLSEFEREYGSAGSGVHAGSIFTLWLSTRKNGCTEDQIKRGEYALTLDECGRVFTKRLMMKLDSAMYAVLVASGWVPDATEADDALDPTPGAGNGPTDCLVDSKPGELSASSGSV